MGAVGRVLRGAVKDGFVSQARGLEQGEKNVLSLFLDTILTLKVGSNIGKIQSFSCTSELNFTY